MRKLLYVVLLVVPVLVFGDVGIGSAAEDAEFEFILPSIVAVYISNASIVWDFANVSSNANNPAFPPASFPEYYEPSSPNVRPYQTIDYLVMFAGATVDWELTVVGDGDPAPACGIAIDEIEYAANPPVAWTPFSTTAAAVASGSGTTSGWQSLDQNYRVEIDGDEANTASSTCTITYSIQTL
jgi:hypothetical protein